MIKDSPELLELREKFKVYYHNKLEEKFSAMEKERQKYRNIFWMLSLGIFIVLPAFFALFFRKYFSPENIDAFLSNEFGMQGVLLIAMIIAAVLHAPVWMYKRKAKNEVMEPLIGFFGNFQYKYECELSEDLMEKSRLFSYFDGSNTDDYFCGSYKDVGITISEENLYKIVRTKKGSHHYTIFKGVVVVLDMNKKFKGQTVVKRDKGWFLNKFSGTGLKRVALEDIVFEKMFEAFSDDQIEARYLLTTAFMDRMVRLKNSYRAKKIEFSFFDNKLVIAIGVGKNMFEVSSIFRSSTDYRHVEEVFNQFYSIFSIIDILKLNQKAVL